MYGQQPYHRKTFFDVAFKGWLKFVFIIGVVLLILGPVVSGVLASMKPVNQFYETSAGTVRIDISNMASQPVTITCSHTWKVTPSMMGFYTADSLSVVYYNIKIFNKNGNSVYNESNTVELPDEITFYGYDTVSKAVSSDNQANIPPGNYEMTVTSTQSLSCVVVQKFKYQDAMIGMVLIALVGVIVIALWVWLGLYTTKHIPLTTHLGAPGTQVQAQPPVSQPSYYSNLYSSQGVQPAASPPVYQAPAPTSYSYPPSYDTSSQELIAPSQPQNYNPTQTNLEYRTGGYVMELVCANCHRSVRSQPVDGVVTCESCGEKARVY